MKKLLLTVSITTALLLGLTWMSSQAAFDAGDDVAAAVNKQADAFASGKHKHDDLLKSAEKLATSDKLKGHLDLIYKTLHRRDRGGFGVGPEGKFSPDGIEAIILNMRRRIPPAALGEDQKHVIRALHQTSAVASFAYHLPPTKAKDGENLKNWKKWSKDMMTTSHDLAHLLKASNDTDAEKAAKAKDAAKTAARALNATCTQCHKGIRDAK